MQHMQRITPENSGITLHKTWHDPNGRMRVVCSAVDDATLMRLAAGADEIEIRQAPGANPVSPDMVAQLNFALVALPLLLGDTMQNSGAALRRLRLVLSDRLARIRIRHNRHVLARRIRRPSENGDILVLVLVLVSRRVSGCDWYLDF
ncbi:hypothetical protein [Dongia sp.]|uniref:hypothetical protein n=1 Tax=Dongia sp. TaxID=1977262 RepID=UPI0035B2DD9B